MVSSLAQAIEEGRDELTPQEARLFAEEQVQEYLGISVEEFARQAKEGVLPKEDPMILHLALLTGVPAKSC